MAKSTRKLNTSYDISEAFRTVENELIGSMIRNLNHHRAEELKEGYNWSQWQVEQLAALDEYKKRNMKRYKGVFGNINDQIDTLITMQRAAGNAEQEISILKAMKEGAKLQRAEKNISAAGIFFKINDEKINSLIKSTQNDFKKAETAILRMANDQYRKIIFNAQVYAMTGATYEKAVDMATKDFLSAGINCIEYSNGARHTIADYADMALRTAQKRAYLTGEGEKRMEWGISTVIMNKRGNPCPKCKPFVEKIFIDDVWSGGSKDGISETTGLKYPLISSAIKKGLYHPRCRDSHTTYFEGISTPPDDKYTKEELEELAENYNHEQRQQYAQRQAEKYGRLAKYSLDKENKTKYEIKEHEWKKQLQNPLEKELGTDIINLKTEYGALTDVNDPSYKRRDKHAEIYYNAIRNSKKSYVVKAISKNTGMSEVSISKVYEHVFINKYKLSGGYKNFDPDYDMAESFRRLREGKNIQEHDLILLKHEHLEYGLMNKLGLPYDEAHKLAESKYNYNKALREYKEMKNL